MKLIAYRWLRSYFDQFEHWISTGQQQRPGQLYSQLRPAVLAYAAVLYGCQRFWLEFRERVPVELPSFTWLNIRHTSGQPG